MNQRRFSYELQQEQISRKQIEERFVQFGWIPSTPLDLGEDFIVHIYLDGRATGVTFHVQAKSVTNIAKRRKAAHLLYTLKPKDLKHWEAFSTPVVLIVWDINQREGRWALVADIIKELDKSRPQWRNNTKGVSVQIPWENTLADQGLIHLKQLVGQHFYPQISGGKELEINAKFSFSNTLEGQEIRQAFERHLKEGEPVTLKGRTIQELHFSEWWQQWFGEYDPDTIELQLGPTSAQHPLPATIDIISNKAETASVPQVELRITQAGTEFLKLTNHHQITPLQFTITIRKQGTSLYGSLSITTRGFGYSLDETRNMLGFLQAISSGGRVRVAFNSLENQTLVMATDPQPDAAPDPRLVELVNMLVEIQNKTRQFIRIPDQGVSSDDMKSISELHEILTFGSTTMTNAIATIDLKKEALEIMLDVHRQEKPIYLQLTSDDSFVELLGTRIPTGPMIRSVTGFIEMPVTELEEAIVRLNADQFLPLRLVRATVTETFSRWTPQQMRSSIEGVAA